MPAQSQALMELAQELRTSGNVDGNVIILQLRRLHAQGGSSLSPYGM
jgi:hypothetical protein